MGAKILAINGLLASIGIILLIMALTACSTTLAPINDPRAVWCENNQPRRPSVAAINAMTRAELDELNAYNRKGVDWCGWKAPGV